MEITRGHRLLSLAVEGFQSAERRALTALSAPPTRGQQAEGATALSAGERSELLVQASEDLALALHQGRESIKHLERSGQTPWGVVHLREGVRAVDNSTWNFLADTVSSLNGPPSGATLVDRGLPLPSSFGTVRAAATNALFEVENDLKVGIAGRAVDQVITELSSGGRGQQAHVRLGMADRLARSAEDKVGTTAARGAHPPREQLEALQDAAAELGLGVRLAETAGVELHAGGLPWSAVQELRQASVGAREAIGAISNRIQALDGYPTADQGDVAGGVRAFRSSIASTQFQSETHATAAKAGRAAAHARAELGEAGLLDIAGATRARDGTRGLATRALQTHRAGEL